MALASDFLDQLTTIFATFSAVEEVYLVPSARSTSGEDLAVLFSREPEATLLQLQERIKAARFAVPLRLVDVNDVAEDRLDSMEAIYEKSA